MTNEHNFKVGDKVVTKQYYDIDVNGYSTTIPIGEEGVIEDVDDDELYVSFSGYGVFLTLPASDVEPIQPFDRKTAFLRELQALLRKYDARIHDHDYYRLYIDLGIHEDINPLDCIVFTDIVTADNIMDFDKE